MNDKEKKKKGKGKRKKKNRKNRTKTNKRKNKGSEIEEMKKFNILFVDKLQISIPTLFS